MSYAVDCWKSVVIYSAALFTATYNTELAGICLSGVCGDYHG